MLFILSIADTVRPKFSPQGWRQEADTHTSRMFGRMASQFGRFGHPRIRFCDCLLKQWIELFFSRNLMANFPTGQNYAVKSWKGAFIASLMSSLLIFAFTEDALNHQHWCRRNCQRWWRAALRRTQMIDPRSTKSRRNILAGRTGAFQTSWNPFWIV